MPPWLDTPEEAAVVIGGALSVVAAVGVAIITTAGLLYAAWRAKLRPMLAGTQAAAEIAAHEVQNNSGHSLRDAVDGIKKGVDGLGLDVRELRADQRVDRDEARRAHSEIFRRIRALESPDERTLQ